MRLNRGGVLFVEFGLEAREGALVALLLVCERSFEQELLGGVGGGGGAEVFFLLDNVEDALIEHGDEVVFFVAESLDHGLLAAHSMAESAELVFHDGEAEVTEGVTVHCIGGHSRGLQCVRVRTQSGWMVLASDAGHFYENVFARKPFPIVVDLQNMLDGFETLHRLASDPRLIIPGHDPLVRTYFPQAMAPHIHRLDVGQHKEVGR